MDWSEDITIAELADEPALSEELQTTIERAEASPLDAVPHVVLNFANVTYLNSTNIGQLLRLRKRLNESGRSMRLCSMRDEVWTLILAAGLDRIFRVDPDPMTSLAGLQLEQAGEA